MQHNAFDLEVYAKHHRGQIEREIEKRQQLDAARARGQVSSFMPVSRIARLFEAARTWFASTLGRAAPAPKAPPIAADAARERVPTHPPARAPKPVPAGDAYAGLVVIARASSVPVARQPSEVGER